MNRTMLIAEGDAEVCDLYRRFSTQRGYQVETSLDGLDCVRRLRRATPNVLVLNLELHWGGGDGVLGWLREEPQFLPEKVVLTWAETSAHILKRLILPPVVKPLAKPFPLSALFAGPATGAPKEPQHTSNDGRHLGILVVDDDPADREFLQTHLQNHGFHVLTAENGEEALDQCCDYGEETVVILLSAQMQALDRLQIVEGIRAYDIGIPVCIMTGDPGDIEATDLQQQGVHLFGKPLRTDEIARVIANLANERLQWPKGN